MYNIYLNSLPIILYIHIYTLFCYKKYVFYRIQMTGKTFNVSVETLLKQLRETEEQYQKLSTKNINLEQQNQNLTTQITQLQVEMTKMKQDRHKEAERLAINALRKIFSPGQIKMLMSPTKSRIRWSPEDIMSAISLRSLSPKAYKYLRNVKKMPLPCITTWRNWVNQFNVFPGILHDVIKIMSNIGRNLPTTEKLTVCSFDEVYISNKLEVERKQQKIYGPHKTCQFIMARGLFKNWRQPIYYNFDTTMSHDILFSVIRHLYSIGYIVVAVTCDMGPTNMTLWNNLHIGVTTPCRSNNNNAESIEKQCYIMHPANNNLRIYFYADVPHLIKLARNNFLDSGFRIKGASINKMCLEELLTLNEKDLKICHKLSRAHLDAKGAQRQNVKLAVQIFSNRNALALRWCGQNNLLTSTQWKLTSEVLKLFNDWFDIFNSRLKYNIIMVANFMRMESI